MYDKDNTNTQNNEIILSNAKLVFDDKITVGSVKIANGFIADIAEGNMVASGAIDCDGDYLSAGLIELHTDNVERHLQPRPGVKWPMQAAILAHDAELVGVGITTVFDALRIGSITSSNRVIYKKYARDGVNEILALQDRGLFKASHHIHLRCEICSETLIEEIGEYSADDRIGIVSLMDHTPGQRQFRDTKQMETYLKGKYNMSDDEVASHFLELYELQKKYKDPHMKATQEFAQQIGAHIASHDDTTTEDVIESYNVGVSFAEFPTTVEAAKTCAERNIQVMMGAPNLLRGHSHSDNVAAKTLVEHDLLNIMSSDYVPASLLMAAVKLGDMIGNLPAAMKTVTGNPAMATGLVDRGSLALGKRADLITFNTKAQFPQVTSSWVKGKRVA